MKDRLIELLNSAESAVYWNSEDKSFIEKIADHLLANGVIVPPVKVGQTVYINGLMGFGEAEAHRITHAQCRIGSVGQSWFFEALLIGGRGDCGFWDDQIGKTVFLTREAAEQALKERDKNGTS